MKKIITILIIFAYSIIYASGVKTFKYEKNNVMVFITSFSYREEMNKGIIIGEYVNRLCEENHYTDSVKIFLKMKFVKDPQYSMTKTNEFLYLRTESLDFNLIHNLKLIEYAIKNKNRKQFNIENILNKATSDELDRMMKIPIERPKLIDALENKSCYSYFYKDNKFCFYNKNTKKALVEVDSVYLFPEISSHESLIFINKTDFIFTNMADSLKKYNFLPKGMVLYEYAPIEKINHFLVFGVYDRKVEEKNIVVFNTRNNIISRCAF